MNAVPLATAAPATVAAATPANLTGLPSAALTEVYQVYVATGGGKALASKVLDQARDPRSALHHYFEWDNTKAAEAWRLEQAEGLVRRVQVSILPAGATKEIRVRAFIATQALHDAAVTAGDADIANAPVGSYKMVGDITGSPTYEAAVLQDIENDLRRLQYKYRQHTALWATAVQNVVRKTP